MKALKRIVSYFLSFAISVTMMSGLFVFETSAESGANGFEITDGTLVRYSGNSSIVEIPSTVSAIGFGAFGDNDIVEKVIIPSGVTSIGGSAFYSCNNLSDINLPTSVTTIGAHAFDACSSLKSITVPGTVGTIQASTFASCSNLEQVILSEGTSIIGESAFACCYNLNKINIPYGVTTINSRTFYLCKGLTSITLPASVTTICATAFQECRSLANITLSDNITQIDSDAFSYCDSLTSITLPSKLRTLSVAFAFCSKLEEVNIPTNLYTIYGNPFIGCTSLKKFSVSSGNTRYRSVDGVLLSYDQTEIISYPAAKTDISYSIPNSVKTIRQNAFANNASLRTLTLPADLTAFNTIYNCTALQEISISANNSTYCDVSGVLFSKDKATLVCYPQARSSQTYSIPNGTTEIGNSSFRWSSNLAGVTIPNTVITIEAYAFANSSITSIELPDSVSFVNGSAFEDCKSLARVVLPDNINILNGISPFMGCNGLKDIYYAGTVEDWEKYVGYEVKLDIPASCTIHYKDGTTSNQTSSANSTPSNSIFTVVVDFSYGGEVQRVADVNTGAIEWLNKESILTVNSGDNLILKLLPYDYYDVSQVYINETLIGQTDTVNIANIDRDIFVYIDFDVEDSGALVNYNNEYFRKCSREADFDLDDILGRSGYRRFLIHTAACRPVPKDGPAIHNCDDDLSGCQRDRYRTKYHQDP